MQILLGVDETIVKINSQTMSIEYIQHFISTHFKSRKIEDNFIYIPSTKEDNHHRSFLLKWIYSLYAKKHGYMPSLKESLLKRQNKAIKIITKKKIVHTLVYEVINRETIHVSIKPANNNIAYTLKTFLQTKIIITPSYLQIVFITQEEKNLLYQFIHTNTLINVPHKHKYNKNDMEAFLYEKAKEVKLSTEIQSAYMILGISQLDDAKTIKKRYKSLAKKFHPDMMQEQDSKMLEVYTRKFQNILEAYSLVNCAMQK